MYVHIFLLYNPLTEDQTDTREKVLDNYPGRLKGHALTPPPHVAITCPLYTSSKFVTQL